MQRVSFEDNVNFSLLCDNNSHVLISVRNLDPFDLLVLYEFLLKNGLKVVLKEVRPSA